MKIALVSYDAFQGRSTGYYPPLHLCRLATQLGLAGEEVRIFDYAGEFRGMDPFFAEIRDYGPDLVGLTCYTPYLVPFDRITRRLRTFLPRAAMVAGGPHPTVRPRWTLEKLDHLDYALRGEADHALPSLADLLAGRCSPEDVPGLVYRDGAAVIANPPERIDDLDRLPPLDRSYLDPYYREGMYWNLAARGKLDMMISSRGCPHNCRFCFQVEKKCRFRSVENLMAEFEELRRRGVRSVHIQDDSFTANRSRCLEVAENLIGGKYRFDLKIRSRVDAVDRELLEKLKAAGVKQIVYGFESGSDRVLEAMGKGTTVAMNLQAARLTKKAGIGCYGEIMVGFPGETPETVEETIAFLRRAKPIVGFVPVLYPLPGTEVYEEAKKNGTLQGDWDITGPWPWIKLPWTESYSDLTAASKRIVRRVQRDPGTILYFLRRHLPALNWRAIKFLLRVFRDLHLRLRRVPPYPDWW
jgi:anaerobic magnesium-protoporphyrin IX monomethyl ester cyclase